MRIQVLSILIFGLLSLAVDSYIYVILRRRYPTRKQANIQAAIAAALYIMVFVAVLLPRDSGGEGVLMAVMWMLFGYVSVLFSKIVFIIFDLLAKIPLLWHHRRMHWLTRTGVMLGVVTFLLMWWGALFNRFNLQVKEVTVHIENLPTGMKGLRIAQISDLHVGTFGTDTTFVCRLVDSINGLHPDVVMFTGDIVNRRSTEFAPFVNTLSRLKAPMGVYAVLGNHDYGDYMEWASPEDKEANMALLHDYYDAIGWNLLLNSTVWLSRGADSIAVIGVENVGDPPFKNYGDINEAYPHINDSHTKILLSHNPAHWADSIAPNPDINVALTLSGHTHAMQAELFGVSPSAIRYPTWGGLYESADKKRKLYVNIGAGTVGFPSRIGATPEITLITLE